MAKKRSSAAANGSSIVDGVEPGKGAAGAKTRFIVPYGPPGSLKTTACGKIGGAKWVVADQNCIPTLDVQDLLPPDKDLYEVGDLTEATNLIRTWTDAAVEGKLRIPAVVVDSITALHDFTEQDVATAHGSSYLGENAKDNGWQDFNNRLGRFIDALGELARHVNVLAICHAREKADATKGDWQGLNLGPKCANKLARVANWVLYHTIQSESWSEGMVEGPLLWRRDTPEGALAVHCQVHTMPTGLWLAKVNARNLDAIEPPDYGAILKKEGLIG